MAAVWSAEWAAAGTVVTAVYHACVVCLAWADPLHACLVDPLDDSYPHLPEEDTALNQPSNIKLQVLPPSIDIHQLD